MRTILTALSDELKRLKTAGVRTVTVSDEGMAALRTMVAQSKERGGRKQEPEGETQFAAAPSASPGPRPEIRASAAIEAALPPASRRTPPATAVLPPPPVVELPAGSKAARWEALRELVLSHPVCRAQVRPGKKVVLGVGSLDAQIMFVGEAPGADEEVQGEPFVGPAGQLLTKMIQGMGLKREDVYIGNIMNWRPQLPTDSGEQTGNRPPTTEELAFCLPFLRAQIEVVNPALLVALGKTALEGLLGPGRFKTLGEARGQWHEFAGRPVMVTYHPSYILREPTPKKKRLIWEDLLKVMERAALPISQKQRDYFLDK